MGRPRLAVLGVVVGAFFLCALAGWGVLTAAGGSHPGQRVDGPKGGPKAGALIQRNFALFSTPPEGLPRSIRSVIAANGEFTLDPDLAQRLPVGSAGKAWALAEGGLICILAGRGIHSFATVCAPVRRALQSGVAMTTLPRGGHARRTIVGVAPNDVRAVIAEDGVSPVRIPVRADVFSRRDDVDEAPDRFAPVR